MLAGIGLDKQGVELPPLGQLGRLGQPIVLKPAADTAVRQVDHPLLVVLAGDQLRVDVHLSHVV